VLRGRHVEFGDDSAWGLKARFPNRGRAGREGRVLEKAKRML